MIGCNRRRGVAIYKNHPKMQMALRCACWAIRWLALHDFRRVRNYICGIHIVHILFPLPNLLRQLFSPFVWNFFSPVPPSPASRIEGLCAWTDPQYSVSDFHTSDHRAGFICPALDLFYLIRIVFHFQIEIESGRGRQFPISTTRANTNSPAFITSILISNFHLPIRPCQ